MGFRTSASQKAVSSASSPARMSGPSFEIRSIDAA
jgi:hypothetical protein